MASSRMSDVYKAHDPERSRNVAVKLLRAHAERGLQEARAHARVRHPNVVEVYDAGVADRQPYLVMELVEGDTLEAWLHGRERHWIDVVTAFHRAGDGLVAAHEVGVVHADFKSANVLIADDGRVLLTDFGLARRTPTPPRPDRRTEGTPAYMAPEQFLGRVDFASDQFSLCASLYEALVAELPTRNSEASPLPRVRTADELSEKLQHVPTTIRDAVLRGLEEDPARRHRSLRALLRELAGHWGEPRSAFGCPGLASPAAGAGTARPTRVKSMGARTRCYGLRRPQSGPGSR